MNQTKWNERYVNKKRERRATRERESVRERPKKQLHTNDIINMSTPSEKKAVDPVVSQTNPEKSGGEAAIHRPSSKKKRNKKKKKKKSPDGYECKYNTMGIKKPQDEVYSDTDCSLAVSVRSNPEGFPFVLKASERVGRCAVAVRNIEAGELVLREKPVVWMPDA